MPDRRTPFENVDEKQMLVAFLDYLRESVILKLNGLTDEQAREPGVPSGTSLLWLVKHLALVERAWFQFAFGGSHGSVVGSDELEPSDTIDSVVADYRSSIAVSNEIIANCDDLDRLCAQRSVAPHPMSMRWVLVHMVEETGRHAGHADILRERVDGSVGR